MQLRIITISPDNEYLSLKDIDENKVKGSTADSIEKLLEWSKQLKKGSENNIEIRALNSLPTEVYFRLDNNIFVGPYQLNRESQQSITMKYSGDTKGFHYYKNYFDELWKEGTPISLI